MGNPHAIVFVDDVDALDLAGVGPQFETAPVGQGCNNNNNNNNFEYIKLQIKKYIHVKFNIPLVYSYQPRNFRPRSIRSSCR